MCGRRKRGEGDRERGCVSIRERERECMCERERWRESKRGEIGKMMCVCMCVRGGGWRGRERD